MDRNDCKSNWRRVQGLYLKGWHSYCYDQSICKSIIFFSFTFATSIRCNTKKSGLSWSKQVANMIRFVVDSYNKPIPAILEIPSKDHPYDPAHDSVLSRVKYLFSAESVASDRRWSGETVKVPTKPMVKLCTWLCDLLFVCDIFYSQLYYIKRVKCLHICY